METNPFLTSPEARAFYQRRVGTFGLIMAVAGAIGFAFRVAIGVASGTPFSHFSDPTYLLHAAGIIPCFLMWLICSRRWSLPVSAVIAVETFGLLFASILFIGMGMTIPPEVGADVITAFVLSFAFFARAVFVPSTPGYTAILAVIIGVPLILMMTVHYLDVDAEMWRRIGYDTRGFDRTRIAIASGLMTTMWWTLTVGLSSIASRVIHRLRSEVSSIRSLGQYQLERKLGEGAMGVVYQATHGMLKRPTAVKLLRPELGGLEMLERFRREVQLTASLTHSHTITIYDYGRTPDGLFYYAMELLEGANLQELVDATGPQPVRRVVHILRDVALALDEAHSVGLIHRDIKPTNIMLARKGGTHDIVKVLDFGLVKRMLEDGDPDTSNSGAVEGTPLYMSPESIKDPPAVDSRSDLYALGAVGYYLLTGRPVFEGDDEFDVYMEHLAKAPVSVSEVRADPVPPELERLVLACLAKDKQDRPQSAQALADALDRLDLSLWTRTDAAEWWKQYGARVEQERESKAPSMTGQTMEVVLESAWFERIDQASPKA